MSYMCKVVPMQAGEILYVDIIIIIIIVVVFVDIRPYIRVEAIQKSRLVPPLSIFRICAWPLAGSPTSCASLLSGPRYFHHRQNVQTGSGFHPGSYNNGYRG